MCLVFCEFLFYFVSLCLTCVSLVLLPMSCLPWFLPGVSQPVSHACYPICVCISLGFFFVTSSLISVSVLAVSVFFLGFSPFCLIRELPANEAEGFFELVLFLGPNLPAAWQSITSVVYDVFNIFWSIGESSCFHSCCPAFICVALYTCEQVHQEASEGSAFHEPYHLDWDDAMEKSSILLSMKCHVGLKYPRGGCLKF